MSRSKREKTPPPESKRADYEAKLLAESSYLDEIADGQGLPRPWGDPTSGVLLVVEQDAGPRALEALSLSLDAVGLPDASVCFFSGEALGLCILSLQPRVLVAVGDAPGHEIDSIHHPLAWNSFSQAIPGTYFPWTSSIYGLLVVPSVASALEDPDAKLRFWNAFRRLHHLPGTRKD